jgi:hypothetical protein
MFPSTLSWTELLIWFQMTKRCERISFDVEVQWSREECVIKCNKLISEIINRLVELWSIEFSSQVEKVHWTRSHIWETFAEMMSTFTGISFLAGITAKSDALAEPLAVPWTPSSVNNGLVNTKSILTHRNDWWWIFRFPIFRVAPRIEYRVTLTFDVNWSLVFRIIWPLWQTRPKRNIEGRLRPRRIAIWEY